MAKPKIYLDQDNTLALFSKSKQDEPMALEKMYEKGFFRNLPVIGNPALSVEILQGLGYEVFILTKCIESPYCIPEKWEWLQEHLPMIDKEHFIPVPANGNKTDYCEPFGNVLVDDYKGNLFQWEHEGGLAVKFSSNPSKTHPFKTVYSLVGLVIFLQRLEETGEWLIY